MNAASESRTIDVHGSGRNFAAASHGSRPTAIMAMAQIFPTAIISREARWGLRPPIERTMQSAVRNERNGSVGSM